MFSLISLALAAATTLVAASADFELVTRAAPKKVPVYTTCKRPSAVALAFDDGVYDYTQNISHTLDVNGVKGTFFMNGNNWRCIYNFVDDIRARYAKGHMLASHTWSHVDLATLNEAQLNRQFQLVEDAFVRILGVLPLYFRPPYGSYNDLVLQVAYKRGYKGAITWDYDSGDSSVPETPGKTIISNYEKAFKSPSTRSTSITLNHDVKAETAFQVIPAITPWLKKRGYKLETVASCLQLGDSPSSWYKKVGKPGKPNASWTCEGTPGPGVP